MTFGDRLREIRESKGLYPKQVAPLIHVSVPTYCTYEADTTTPSIDRCGKICRALDIEPEELFKGVEL